MNIEVSATDPSGVSKIDIYVNNAFYCTRTTPVNGTVYSCLWQAPAKKGTYTIKATGYGTKNNATSASVSVTVR